MRGEPETSFQVPVLVECCLEPGMSADGVRFFVSNICLRRRGIFQVCRHVFFLGAAAVILCIPLSLAVSRMVAGPLRELRKTVKGFGREEN